MIAGDEGERPTEQVPRLTALRSPVTREGDPSQSCQSDNCAEHQSYLTSKSLLGESWYDFGYEGAWPDHYYRCY